MSHNFIHHVGRWELADMGAIYVLGRAPGTLLEGNVIAHVSPYHLYGWGVCGGDARICATPPRA